MLWAIQFPGVLRPRSWFPRNQALQNLIHRGLIYDRIWFLVTLDPPQSQSRWGLGPRQCFEDPRAYRKKIESLQISVKDTPTIFPYSRVYTQYNIRPQLSLLRVQAKLKNTASQQVHYGPIWGWLRINQGSKILCSCPFKLSCNGNIIMVIICKYLLF
jgi:hypothetical protein